MPDPIDNPTGILSKATPSDIPRPVPIDKDPLNIKTGIFLFLEAVASDIVLVSQLLPRAIKDIETPSMTIVSISRQITLIEIPASRAVPLARFAASVERTLA